MVSGGQNCSTLTLCADELVAEDTSYLVVFSASPVESGPFQLSTCLTFVNGDVVSNLYTPCLQ